MPDDPCSLSAPTESPQNSHGRAAGRSELLMALNQILDNAGADSNGVLHWLNFDPWEVDNDTPESHTRT